MLVSKSFFDFALCAICYLSIGLFINLLTFVELLFCVFFCLLSFLDLACGLCFCFDFHFTSLGFHPNRFPPTYTNGTTTACSCSNDWSWSLYFQPSYCCTSRMSSVFSTSSAVVAGPPVVASVASLCCSRSSSSYTVGLTLKLKLENKCFTTWHMQHPLLLNTTMAFSIASFSTFSSATCLVQWNRNVDSKLYQVQCSNGRLLEID